MKLWAVRSSRFNKLITEETCGPPRPRPQPPNPTDPPPTIDDLRPNGVQYQKWIETAGEALRMMGEFGRDLGEGGASGLVPCATCNLPGKNSF